MQWSARRWRRYAAEIGTALIISVPLFSAGAAMAGPEAEPQVEFGGGGLGLLLCGSKPNVPSISVPSQSKVIFINNLGQGAQLQIDGADGGPVGSGEAVEIQFHRGPVSVAMVPECLLNLNGSFEPVTVQVSQPRTTTSTTTRSTTSPKPSATSGTRTSPSPASSHPATATGTAGPGQTEPDLNDPLFQIDTGTEGDNPSPSAATVVKNPDGSLANPALSPMSQSDRGPIRLLAIIATVCVVGVSAGAIRAIISQRASRAEFA